MKSININKQNIEVETAKAVLVKMPHSSAYDGFKFWHPAKLVWDGRHSNAVALGYTDEFTFKLIKNGNGRYNRFEVIDTKEITVAEFEKAFGVMDDNITARQQPNPYETHKPEEVEAEQAEVAEELKDND